MKQTSQIFIKLIYVNRFQALKVIIPFLVLWSVLPVDKIVVDRKRMRTQAVYPELDGQPVRKGRLSRRRRSCHKHKLHITSFCDLFRNFSNLLFLLCFLHQYHVLSSLPHNFAVQIANGFNILEITPFHGFFLYLKQLFPHL